MDFAPGQGPSAGNAGNGEPGKRVRCSGPWAPSGTAHPVLDIMLIAGEDSQALKVTFKGLGGVKHLLNSGALGQPPGNPRVAQGRCRAMLGGAWHGGQRAGSPRAAAAAAAPRPPNRRSSLLLR